MFKLIFVCSKYDFLDSWSWVIGFLARSQHGVELQLTCIDIIDHSYPFSPLRDNVITLRGVFICIDSHLWINSVILSLRANIIWKYFCRRKIIFGDQKIFLDLFFYLRRSKIFPGIKKSYLEIRAMRLTMRKTSSYIFSSILNRSGSHLPYRLELQWRLAPTVP